MTDTDDQLRVEKAARKLQRQQLLMKATDQERAILMRIEAQREALHERALKLREIEELERRAGLRPRGLASFAQTAARQSKPLLAVRDAVYRHPVAIGFTLGCALVLAPRRMLRMTTMVVPTALRLLRYLDR